MVVIILILLFPADPLGMEQALYVGKGKDSYIFVYQPPADGNEGRDKEPGDQ